MESNTLNIPPPRNFMVLDNEMYVFNNYQSAPLGRSVLVKQIMRIKKFEDPLIYLKNYTSTVV
jgi:hypothetical protein